MEGGSRYYSDHNAYFDGVMVGMIYGGMYLHRLLIRRYTCWWNVWEEDEKEDEN